MGIAALVFSACGNQKTGVSQQEGQAASEGDNVVLKVADFVLELGAIGELNDRWYDVEMLAADAPNYITGENIPEGMTVTVAGQTLEQGQTIEVMVEHMAKDQGIPVTVTEADSTGGIGETCYIRTLNYDIPEIDYYVDPDVEPGVYYTILNGWLLKYDNQKQEYVFFWDQGRGSCMDFQRTEIDGEVYYSFMRYVTNEFRPNYATTGGWNYCEVVVLDENYQEVTIIDQMSTSGRIEDVWPPEGHEHVILGKDHYLLLGYVPVWVDNIPDTVSHSPYGTKVVAAVIQEIKDGELVWEWWSTDHPEFYEMSIESNDWFNSTLQWDDYMHINSMTVDPKDGNIVCSARHLNAVFEIDKETKELNWVLGGKMDEFGLSEEQKFKRQHFARFTEDGTLTLFDNQTDWVSSGFPEEDEADVGTGFPRVIEMKIDEQNKELIEYNAYDMQRHTGEFMGSATKVGEETFMIGWGGSIRCSTNALFTEVDFASQKILCEAVATGNTSFQTYRVYKYAE